MANPYDALAADGPPVRSASAFDFRNSGRTSVGPESMRRAATPTANMASEAYNARRSSSPGTRASGAFVHAFTPLSQHSGETSTKNNAESPSGDQGSAYGAGYGAYGYGAQPANATFSPFGRGASPAAQSSYYEQQGYGAYQTSHRNVSGGSYGQNGYEGGWYSEQYGAQAGNYAPTSQYQPETNTTYEPQTTNGGATNYEEDDDLGFGNSSLRKARAATAAPAESDASQTVKGESEAVEKQSEGESKTEEKKQGTTLL